MLGWGALCAALSLFMIVTKCRIPHTKRVRWLPLVPFALFRWHMFMRMPKKIHWVWVLAGDMTVAQCVMFTGILKVDQCGLIQSNRGYDELLEAATLPQCRSRMKIFCTKHRYDAAAASAK